MRGDHIVTRFHLARWASPEGKVAVLKRRSREVTLEDPAEFNRVDGFNSMQAPDGSEDRWLEQEFFGGLDNDVARYMGQLEHVQPPPSHLRRIRKEGWHPTHLLAPRHNVRLAMFVGAQMVRSPDWRDAISLDTAADMKRTVEAGVNRKLAGTIDPKEIERLNKLLGLRYLVTETPKNVVPHLSGHLAYRIGKVLYERYTWAVHCFDESILAIGNDPVVLVADSPRRYIGSFSQIARAKNALSIYAPLPEMVDSALDVVSSSGRIMMPLGPRHALVLTRVEQFWPPGRYDQPAKLAEIFNGLTAVSSIQWIGWLPGSEPRIATKVPAGRVKPVSASQGQSPRS